MTEELYKTHITNIKNMMTFLNREIYSIYVTDKYHTIVTFRLENDILTIESSSNGFYSYERTITDEEVKQDLIYVINKAETELSSMCRQKALQEIETSVTRAYLSNRNIQELERL